jgi:uncharacterized integral membrane protein
VDALVGGLLLLLLLLLFYVCDVDFDVDFVCLDLFVRSFQDVTAIIFCVSLAGNF